MPAHLTFSEEIKVMVSHSKLDEEASSFNLRVSQEFYLKGLSRESRIIVADSIPRKLFVDGSGFDSKVPYMCRA